MPRSETLLKLLSLEDLAERRANLPPALPEALTAMLAAPSEVALLSLRELG